MSYSVKVYIEEYNEWKTDCIVNSKRDAVDRVYWLTRVSSLSRQVPAMIVNNSTSKEKEVKPYF